MLAFYSHMRALPRNSLLKLPQQARSIETVHAVLDAGMKVLVEEGAIGFNTNRVAEVAGISPGSLYQYFANGDMILAAMIERGVLDAEELFRAAFASTHDRPIDEMLRAPLVKSIILMLTADDLRGFGYAHPMGPKWRGVQDFNPTALSREAILRFCDEVDTRAIRDIFPCGTTKQVAQRLKAFCDAGMRVFKLMEYGSMAGLRFSAESAGKVRDAEDVLLALLETPTPEAPAAGRPGRPKLDADALLAGAQRETGLTDWADDTLPQRFSLAVDHLNRAGLDADGIQQAAAVCRWLLTSRLEFFEDRNRYPIADEVIDRPLFVTGEPRSGTTLMHALMSVDPDARGGEYYGPSGLLQLVGHPVLVQSTAQSHDAGIQRRLWAVSEELTGVTFAI